MKNKQELGNKLWNAGIGGVIGATLLHTFGDIYYFLIIAVLIVITVVGYILYKLK